MKIKLQCDDYRYPHLLSLFFKIEHFSNCMDIDLFGRYSLMNKTVNDIAIV